VQRFLATQAAIYSGFEFTRYMISLPKLRIFRAREEFV
jgi:hypothetical protein